MRVKDSSVEGLFDINRTVPPTDPEPYRVPCGPRNTSTLSTSVALILKYIGTSSTYIETAASVMFWVILFRPGLLALTPLKIIALLMACL